MKNIFSSWKSYIYLDITKVIFYNILTIKILIADKFI